MNKKLLVFAEIILFVFVASSCEIADNQKQTNELVPQEEGDSSKIEFFPDVINESYENWFYKQLRTFGKNI